MKSRLPFTVLCCILSLGTTAHAQKKSLLFGIDGLGFGSQGFDVADTPVMDSLINGSWVEGYHGAYSDQAFSGGVLRTPTRQATVSGPGWSTILTSVWTDRHGVTDNGTSFARGDYANNPPYLATLKEAIPSLTTASYVYWPPIDDYIISSIDNDGDPTNDVDFHTSYMSDSVTIREAVAGIADVNGLDPDAVFVAIDLVDAAGHSCGSSGVCYRQAVERADRVLGRALTAIEERPDFASEQWQIVVTSDHGHRPAGGHGGQSQLERRIPFIVASQSLTQGTLLPLSEQGISHADVAPTILDHYGVPHPEHYWGVSRAAGVVPEPSSFGMLTIAFIGVMISRRPRRAS